MLHVDNYGTSGSFGASAARLGASTPGVPARDGTVYRARKGAAGSSGDLSSAFSTTVVVFGDYRARLGLGASAAARAAGTVGRPAGNLAVNGAGKGVAAVGPTEGRAGLAAVGGGGHNGANLGLGAGTARLGAGAKFRPSRHHTINRTSLGVANTLFK